MPNWNSLVDGQLVDRTALNDAVSTSVFILRSGQTIPTGARCVTTPEGETWVFLDNSFMPTDGRVPWKRDFVPNATTPYHWIADTGTTYCETYVIEQTVFTGFASTQQGFVSADNKIFYPDASLNGVVWFDPTVITAGTDATLINITGSGGSSRPTGAYYHQPTDKLYVDSFYGGGLTVIDCASKSISSTISFGSNSMYSRGNVYYLSAFDEIWAVGNSGFLRINATTEATIPNGAFDGTGSIFVAAVNGKVYIYNDHDTNDIKVYNSSGTLLNTITGLCTNNNPASSTPVSRGYYVDIPNQKIYAGETSSTGGISILDLNTDTLTHLHIPNEGQTYVNVSVVGFHPLRNSIYIGGGIFTATNSSDSQARLWRFDVNLQTITDTIAPSVNLAINSIVYYPANNSVYVGSAGLVPESSPNTGHASDGTIIKFN